MSNQGFTFGPVLEEPQSVLSLHNLDEPQEMIISKPDISTRDVEKVHKQPKENLKHVVPNKQVITKRSQHLSKRSPPKEDHFRTICSFLCGKPKAAFYVPFLMMLMYFVVIWIVFRYGNSNAQSTILIIGIPYFLFAICLSFCFFVKRARGYKVRR
ncbi:hypothetical protein M0813_02128 [Anaeramoeba flamelloides]|uniref:Uncharacterized protein n=1 Tax=Anaeramoeba flamelloides TaxID=1746091 RepID=A0AAV7YSW9_9EUKA|nr:hypothetical protein M0812_21831 [Anaeramoeba flamelloides]KAJ6246874.1 hypothetical protein M0813_02128 [Anaeramoeba flamelloides]